MNGLSIFNNRGLILAGLASACLLTATPALVQAGNTNACGVAAKGETAKGILESSDLTAVAELARSAKYRARFVEHDLAQPLSFTEQMAKPETGIRAQADRLMSEPFKLGDEASVLTAIEFFHGGEANLTRFFEEPKAAIKSLHEMVLKEIKEKNGGNQLVYKDLEAAVKNNIKKVPKNKLNPDPKVTDWRASTSVMAIFAVGSGQVLAFDLPGGHIAIHIGYLDSKDPNTAKSGRSYFLFMGKSGEVERLAVDATDTELLRETETLVKKDDIETVTHGLLEFASKGNAEIFLSAELSKEAATLLGDYIAVYGAESLRHATVGFALRNHPWETDLFLGLWDSKVTALMGKMLVQKPGQDNRKLLIYISGAKPEYRFAVGNDGTGIGVTREARMKQQLIVEQAIEGMGGDKAELIAKLRSLVGSKANELHHDILQTYLEGINNPSAEVQAHYREIADQVNPLLMELHGLVSDPAVIAAINAKMVSEFGEAQPLPPKPPKPPRRQVNAVSAQVYDRAS